MSKIVDITSPAQFSQLINSSTVVVADFWAAWCGPCKTIAPLYEQLSQQLSIPQKITFTKINTDEQQQIAQSFKITGMPTFLVFKRGKETDRIIGADPKKLSAAVQSLAQEAQGMAAGEGSSGSSQWTGLALPRGYSDITDQVDVRGLDLLNADSAKGNARALFDPSKPKSLNTKGKDAANSTKADWVESDTDEQLMLFMPFQATLKVHTLHVTSLPPADSSDDEAPMRPKTINIYVNTTHNLGFEEAEGLTPTQTVELAESDWDKESGTAKIELKFVRFQKCSSIVLFVLDGQGDGEKVRLDRIRVIGETGEKKNPGQLKKVGEDE